MIFFSNFISKNYYWLASVAIIYIKHKVHALKSVPTYNVYWFEMRLINVSLLLWPCTEHRAESHYYVWMLAYWQIIVLYIENNFSLCCRLLFLYTSNLTDDFTVQFVKMLYSDGLHYRGFLRFTANISYLHLTGNHTPFTPVLNFRLVFGRHSAPILVNL